MDIKPPQKRFNFTLDLSFQIRDGSLYYVRMYRCVSVCSVYIYGMDVSAIQALS